MVSLALSRRTWAVAVTLCLVGLAGLVTLIAPGGSVQRSSVHAVYPPTLAISGRVVDSRGGVPRNLVVVTWRESGMGFGGSSVRLGENGEFAARGLEPGTYVLQARPRGEPGGGPPGSEGGVAIVILEDADLTGVTITTRPGTNVRGTVRFEAERPGAATPRVVVNAVVPVREMTQGPMVSSGAAVDGAFVLNNVHGEVVLRCGWTRPASGERWWPKAVLLDGADITNVPTDFESRPDGRLEVVFTERFTGISGRIVDEAGRPVPDALAVVLSANPDLWQGWSTTTEVPRVDATGRFTVGVLPPGDYLAVAFPAGAFSSTSAVLNHVRDLVPLATRVVVSGGERAPVELVISRPPL